MRNYWFINHEFILKFLIKLMAHIFRTNDGRYIVADNEVTIRNIPFDVGLQYVGRFRSSVDSIIKNEDYRYKNGPLIARVSPSRLREVIRTVRDTYYIDSEKEHLSELEKSIS